LGWFSFEKHVGLKEKPGHDKEEYVNPFVEIIMSDLCPL
jgi:hypothetical protein